MVAYKTATILVYRSRTGKRQVHFINAGCAARDRQAEHCLLSEHLQQFKSYPIGYSHIDIAEVGTEEGKLSLFVAIDRTSKFAYAELHTEAIKLD
jgi:hypothetical protein